MTETPIERRAARAILLTPGDRVLLMQIEDPSKDARYWVCPGGGLADGEGAVAGLERELHEELGCGDLTIGPAVYRWRHRFSWNGRLYLQTETFFAVDVPAPFEARMMDDTEALYTMQFRWWHLDEIRKSEVVFSPRKLDGVITCYRAEGAPAELKLEDVVSAG